MGEAGHDACGGCGKVRCVVLLSPEKLNPTALLRSLDQRAVEAETVGDAPTAMGRLIRRDARALVVVAADRQPRLGELLDAVRQYRPRTAVWAYHPGPAGGAGKLVRLSKLDRADRNDGQRRGGAVASTLSGSAAAVEANPADEAAAPVFRPATVTPEELNMLLGSTDEASQR